jgi:SAM-dependent methyltransferase
MAYLDDSLWHHRSGFDDDNGMPEAVRDLYRAVSAEATRPAETEMNTPAGGRRFEERAEIGDHVRTHTEHEHRTRYLWASKRLSGRVLDVACGNGHGSALLARTSDVTGIDRDELATATARARVPAGMFQVSDVPPIPYPDGAFAHAVCFETVEHVADDIAFIRELRRVIAPGGHLLISTPNRAVTSPNETRPSNPYHVREYLLPEFLRLVSDAGFERIVIYFQRKERRRVPEFVASAVIARIPRLCQPGRWWDRLGHGSSDVEPWTEDVTHPQFWVLDCS